MINRLLPKFLITLITIICVICSNEFLFAKEPLVASSSKNMPSSALQAEAQKYREAGLASQDKGNLNEAMSYYQKAIAIDPNYAIAYNDLGIIYEASGFPERAEENYLKAIKIDPTYASAYTNLASFYEGQRDLTKAAFYWSKRAGLGPADDEWVQKAQSRLKDIRIVLSNKPIADLQEDEVLDLVKEVSAHKTLMGKDDKVLSQDHFRKAKLSYNKGDLATAIKEALDAQYLDPDNRQIEEFIEKTESRALSR